MGPVFQGHPGHCGMIPPHVNIGHRFCIGGVSVLFLLYSGFLPQNKNQEPEREHTPGRKWRAAGYTCNRLRMPDWQYGQHHESSRIRSVTRSANFPQPQSRS